MLFSYDMTDYEKAKETFTIPVPDRFNFGFDVIDRHAADRTKLALAWTDPLGREIRKFTYWDVSSHSNKIAYALLSLGIGKGDRVFIMLPRLPEWYFVMVACHKIGAVVMPAPVMLTPSDIEYRIMRGQAAAVITNLANAPKVDAACAATAFPALKHKVLIDGGAAGWTDLGEMTADAPLRLAPGSHETTSAEDPFMIYFTSGTTKYPKMVLHRCSYPLGHLRTALLWHDIKPHDLIWVLSDTGWAKAAWGMYGQWIAGAAIFVHNAEGKFLPRLTMKLLTSQGITMFCAPPTVYRMLILEDLSSYDFSGLRRCTSAGEPLNPEVIYTWQRATNLTIHQGYGQTESSVLLADYPCQHVKPGSTGKPVPDMAIEVLDDDRNPLPPGEIGHICVRVKPDKPVGMFDEYLDDEDENRVAFRGDWYFTGDKAYKDADGYFYFFGRADDVIKSSGYRVGPFEVESVLQEHPAVAESAVVGSPDSLRGEMIKAFVVLAPGYTATQKLAQSIQKFVRQKTASYKCPREIEFIEELPKTISGKIKRAVLKRMERERKTGTDKDTFRL